MELQSFLSHIPSSWVVKHEPPLPPLNPVFAEMGRNFPLSLNMRGKKTSVNILKKQLGEIQQEN